MAPVPLSGVKDGVMTLRDCVLGKVANFPCIYFASMGTSKQMTESLIWKECAVD